MPVDAYSIVAWLKGVNPILATLLVSLLPVVEPRYGVVIGVTLYGASLFEALASSIAALLILSILLTTTIDKILDSGKNGRLSRISLVKRLVTWVEERSKSKASGLVERYGWLGLILFVAVPLPLTGVYTGAVAGLLLGIRGKKLFYALLIGGGLSLLITGLSIGLAV